MSFKDRILDLAGEEFKGNEYSPDRWVILKIIPVEGDIFYKVFGTWLGGYLDGDSWRFNSGITKVIKTDTHYEFYGSSGSRYLCGFHNKGMSMYTDGVATNLCKQIEERKLGTMEILTPDELEEYLAKLEL